MKKYEIAFESLNSESYAKPITVLVMQPDEMDENTGIMCFTHGWGGNRFQHQQQMEWTVDQFNIVCISTEFRMSGYDFNPVTGLGAYRPYDASFFQTFDVLNALRVVMERYPAINHNRIFHYGGSQGGHICLLSSIFAPDTFAFVYVSCSIVHMTPSFVVHAGREFALYELCIRNLLEHSRRIKCPVYIEYGTSDSTVPHFEHSELLINQMRHRNHRLSVKIYEDGEHDLQPTISKFDAYKIMASEPIKTLTRNSVDDFTAGTKVSIPCGKKTLEIDWARQADDLGLAIWK